MAALDLEVHVTTKLLVSVHFTAENKSAASHFLYAMKTESTNATNCKRRLQRTSLSLSETKEGQFLVCLIY